MKIHHTNARSACSLANVFEQCVINRKLLLQALLIADPRECKSLRDGPQSNALSGNLFLSLHVSAPNNEPETTQCWVGQPVVFENGLKRTALSPVV